MCWKVDLRSGFRGRTCSRSYTSREPSGLILQPTSPSGVCQPNLIPMQTVVSDMRTIDTGSSAAGVINPGVEEKTANLGSNFSGAPGDVRSSRCCPRHTEPDVMADGMPVSPLAVAWRADFRPMNLEGDRAMCASVWCYIVHAPRLLVSTKGGVRWPRSS